MPQITKILYHNYVKTKWSPFADNISNAFSWVKFSILIQISLKFIPECSADNKPVLIQVMAWYWPSNKPLHELMTATFCDTFSISPPTVRLAALGCSYFGEIGQSVPLGTQRVDSYTVLAWQTWVVNVSSYGCARRLWKSRHKLGGMLWLIEL